MNKICEICKCEGKYKCPTCLIFYCSVACCKRHRENKCDVIIKDKKKELNLELNRKRKLETTGSAVSETVSEENLRRLRHNEEVKKLLTNPHLRNILVTVDNAVNAERIMQKAMQEPIFVEFADACLKVVDSNNTKEGDKY